MTTTVDHIPAGPARRAPGPDTAQGTYTVAAPDAGSDAGPDTVAVPGTNTDAAPDTDAGQDTDTGSGLAPGPDTRPARDRRPYAWTWRRGRTTAALAVVTASLLLFHAHVPNAVGNLGSLLETFLPWTAALVAVLAAVALVRRSATALVAVLLPALAWVWVFGGMLTDKRAAGGDLTVVTHNVNDANPDPRGTARALAASGAAVLALEELSPATTPRYESALAGTYPYRTVQGTVALWSKYPLRDARPVAIMPWTRALRATVDTPKGPLAVYVAHLASVRVRLDSGFTTGQRDEAARLLADALREERLPRTVLVGDFNGTTDDAALTPVTSRMRSVQDTAGQAFGFSWPAAFPMARIDQILVKGVEPASAWTLPATGSDHLPVAAALRL
ncbi:endonuclease/exonuclease/phosphatase family protein [Streptomyces pathocidini]|uniref:Endonuclease/exonuclease/phosphatase family protein n=1 Tax=Streptomyces pathocidini TaxID=1650571 RepID=A0ABW7UKF5_9ACTN|nr:endonuclease/exonuclease/phosphatase family protein [Streptomyces pathocidini]